MVLMVFCLKININNTKKLLKYDFLGFKFLYIIIKKLITMEKEITKVGRTVSIDKKLDIIMNDTITNKSKYIEWLIFQDLKKNGKDRRIDDVII